MNASSTSDVRKISVHAKISKSALILLSYTKDKSRWIKSIPIRSESQRYKEENIDIILHDTEGKILFRDEPSLTKQVESLVNIWSYMKLRSACALKEIMMWDQKWTMQSNVLPLIYKPMKLQSWNIKINRYDMKLLVAHVAKHLDLCSNYPGKVKCILDCRCNWTLHSNYCFHFNIFTSFCFWSHTLRWCSVLNPSLLCNQ